MAQETQDTTRAPSAEPVPGYDHMAADDLWAMLEDGWVYELVEGRLVRTAPPGGTPGEIAAMLSWALSSFVIPRTLGRVLAAETGFDLGHGHVRAPDVAFVAASRVPARDDAARVTYWRLAPDLVGEVVSPSQSRADMEETARAWLAAGTRLVWVVWPDTQQVDVWRPEGTSQPTLTLGRSDALDGLDVLPGFTYPLADLFA
jgi:Uma2 family endonuclease